jgi:hypothetical protein
MIIADEILISLFNANNFSQTLLTSIDTQTDQGEDVCELEWKYILLGQWIRVLQDFYNTNFDTEGQIITPDYETITLVQAQNIMANLKIAQGGNKYPLTNMFQLGIWWEANNFYWDDNLTWFDEVELT